MKRHKLQITDLILRDAHQSLIATRMRLEDMLPALDALDRVGYYSLEMWGGATFDVCLRFLNENPWERLREIRGRVKRTKLQMLLRGQNLVGYRHYPDDVVRAFVFRAKEAGIDVFRIFDALNDIRNLAPAMAAAKEAGAEVEGTISFTISPVHTIEGFVEFGRELREAGADIICIKDMAGMISPAAAAELTRAIKEEVDLPVHLHTHCASGMAPAAIYAAAEAGLDYADCALSPLSWGTSHAPTESIAGALAGTPWDPELDMEAMTEAAEHFKRVRERYLPLLDSRSERVDTRILQHQIPGGMLSNLLSQLKAQKAEDKFDQVLTETARVRKDLGYPPLVTPTSQIVGTQAVFNVVAGERYKTVTREVSDYLKGLYGKSPAPVSTDLRKQVLGDEEPTTTRPAEGMPPEMAGCLEKAKEWEGGEEEALCWALFPPQAEEFFTARREGRLPGTAEPPPEEMVPASREVTAAAGKGARELHLTLEGEKSRVLIGDGPGPGEMSLELDGERYQVKVDRRSGRRRSSNTDDESSHQDQNSVCAPMPGTLVEVRVKEGDQVEQGQVVAVLEAMKMQNELESPVTGTVKAVKGQPGKSMEMNQPIVELEPAS